MFYHILIGCDGSAQGKKGLEYGLGFAMHAGAALTIVTVSGRPPDYLLSPPPRVDDVAARAEAEAPRFAEMGAAQARAGSAETVRMTVLQGRPAAGIPSVADARGRDCIVVG